LLDIYESVAELMIQQVHIHEKSNDSDSHFYKSSDTRYFFFIAMNAIKIYILTILDIFGII